MTLFLGHYYTRHLTQSKGLVNVSQDADVASQVDPDPPVSAGNGPSGICLSYLLSGHIPYVKPGAIHPHPLLQRKLAEAPGVSILDQVSLTHECGRGILLGKSQGYLENQAQSRGAHKTNQKTGREQLGWFSETADTMSAV